MSLKVAERCESCVAIINLDDDIFPTPEIATGSSSVNEPSGATGYDSHVVIFGEHPYCNNTDDNVMFGSRTNVEIAQQLCETEKCLFHFTTTTMIYGLCGNRWLQNAKGTTLRKNQHIFLSLKCLRGTLL